ncbi:GNAT family N-acetyltransferase [Pseudomonas sp. ZM23]|uniref:GNAT family N-acetyltransferase n=1 Tax=Pseudomonas triclosanedens TaxID=2961893 RepID=A0ABY6ZZQ2_9PSED|nr:GNAT family N-acetyltransferase [Pseudomonas triclosanedens]MCP8462621.1 GNAT family N-acetyltransferase [Pseudomonas triclosanedens]MCP8468240.1 GNAT family N-acetyltransferase [Pseudomonas triclosanedens]MCP8474999.1 GNAT family N-acetyltransferase [Pseudomonas triclosanedens]WAI49811.1 GNAT family N-acetyltransferase [Pseudomonas triclosanedens]
MPATFNFTLGADPQARDVVAQGLLTYNLEQMGRSNVYDNFELYARDADDEVVGGMFGHSGMGWLYIDYLWLQSGLRGEGLGAELIARAEDEARRRGCLGVFLYTYSFQAPGFYEKQGFEVMGILEDCPPGHQRIYLKKRLG